MDQNTITRIYCDVDDFHTALEGYRVYRRDWPAPLMPPYYLADIGKMIGRVFPV
jgi:hypothetical protein